MKYDDALRLWGAKKLEEAERRAWTTPRPAVDLSSVKVRFRFDEGYSCCGGSDPNCYCSQATSPVADVEITGANVDGNYMVAMIDADEFDFVTVLGEIVAVADGAIHG